MAELLTRARQADPQLDSSLATAVLAAFVLLNGEGDLDTAHRLLVAALETTATKSVPGHVLDETIHTLTLVCFFGDRRELWAPFKAALEHFGSELFPIQVLAATTFADPQRSTPTNLVALDQIIAGLHHETDPCTSCESRSPPTSSDDWTTGRLPRCATSRHR